MTKAASVDPRTSTPTAASTAEVPEPFAHRLEWSLIGPPPRTCQLEHWRREAPRLDVTPQGATWRLLLTSSVRRDVPGIDAGTRMSAVGRLGEHRGHLAPLNPSCSLHPEH